MFSKSILQSRTFWLNVVTGFAAALAAITQSVPPDAMPYLLMLSSALNVLLRWLSAGGQVTLTMPK